MAKKHLYIETTTGNTKAETVPTPYSDAEIKTKYEANADTNAFTDTEKTKLSGVAVNANNYVHPTTAGNKHMPSGGTVGQAIINTAPGTGTWQDLSEGGDGGITIAAFLLYS